MNEEKQFIRYRQLSGPSKTIQRILFLLIVFFGLAFNLRLHIYLKLHIFTEQWVGIFLTLFLICTFISLPARKNEARDRVPWYDVLLILFALPAGLWITINYPSVVTTLGQLSMERVVVATLAIILIIEAARRLFGLVLVVIAVIFILYGALSQYFPGILAGAPVSWGKLVNYLYLDPNSMLNLLNLAATIGIAFVFFGQVLLKFGGSDALTKLAILLLGRTRGGPAKAAVVGSSLVGTMTGAPASNVFLTGSVTIPMMTRAGYSPNFAGAVEAVASSGGQIMPPVMGIAAFIIAERVGIPYAEVALAALIPAILFYIALFTQVDLEAGKRNLRGLKKEEMPSLKETLQECWPVFPVIGILVLTIFIMRISPGLAGVISGLLAIPFLILRKENRTDLFSKIKSVFEDTGRMMLDGAAALAIAGIVVGVVAISGLGFTMGYVLTALGEGNVYLLLLFGAIGSIILGMGMPSVAAYSLVAVLVAPALTEFGLDVLAVHLFIFYFSIVSNFTPPIAIAVFAASILTGTKPMQMAFVATRLGILAYIVPFLFVLSPSLILKGTVAEITISLITAIIGSILVGGGIIGYLFSHLSWVSRALLLLGGVLLLIPISGMGMSIILNCLGLIISLVVVISLYIRQVKTKRDVSFDT